MSPSAEILGLAAACVACCAVPALGPVLAGLALAGLGATVSGWIVGLIVLAITAIGIAIAVRHRGAAAPAWAGTAAGYGRRTASPVRNEGKRP